MEQRIELWAVVLVLQQIKNQRIHWWFANKDGIDHIVDRRKM